MFTSAVKAALMAQLVSTVVELVVFTAVILKELAAVAEATYEKS
jgi:hypothetical protein